MDNELNSSSIGAASRFIDAKLATGFASFSLTELTDKTGLSVIACQQKSVVAPERKSSSCWFQRLND